MLYALPVFLLWTVPVIVALAVAIPLSSNCLERPWLGKGSASIVMTLTIALWIRYWEFGSLSEWTVWVSLLPVGFLIGSLTFAGVRKWTGSKRGISILLVGGVFIVLAVLFIFIALIGIIARIG
jgi:hypothetical protein